MPELGKATYYLEVDASEFDRKLAEAKAEAAAVAASINKSLSDLKIGADTHVRAVQNISDAHSDLGDNASGVYSDLLKSMTSLKEASNGDFGQGLDNMLLTTRDLHDQFGATNDLVQLMDRRVDSLASKIERAHEFGFSTSQAETELATLSRMLDRFYRDSSNRAIQFDRDMSRRVGLSGGLTRDSLLARMLGLNYASSPEGGVGVSVAEQAMMANIISQIEAGATPKGTGGVGGGGGARRNDGSNRGGGNDGGFLRALWGRGLFGLAGVGTAAGFAGFGFEHAAATGLGILGSLGGAVGGLGVTGLGAAGTLGVGMGSDMAVSSSSIADTKALYTAYNNLQSAVQQYGANSVAAQQATQALDQQMNALGDTAGVKAELGVAKLATQTNKLWDAETSTARVGVTKIMDQVLLLAQKYIPLVNTAATRNLGLINTGLKPLFDWLGGPQGMGIYKNLENVFAAQLPTAVHAFDQAIEFLLKTMNFASRYTGGFTDALDDFFTKWNSAPFFAKWETEMGRLINDLHVWEHFVKLLVEDIFDVFRNDQGTGNAIISTLTRGLEKLHEWENSTSGRNNIRTIFEIHKQEVLALLHAIGGLAPALGGLEKVYMTIFPAMAGAVTSFLKAITPLVNTLAKAFESLAGSSKAAAIFLGGIIMLWRGGKLGSVLGLMKGAAGGSLLSAGEAAGAGAAAAGAGGGAAAAGAASESEMLAMWGGGAGGLMAAGKLLGRGILNFLAKGLVRGGLTALAGVTLSQLVGKAVGGSGGHDITGIGSAAAIGAGASALIPGLGMGPAALIAGLIKAYNVFSTNYTAQGKSAIAGLGGATAGASADQLKNLLASVSNSSGRNGVFPWTPDTIKLIQEADKALQSFVSTGNRQGIQDIIDKAKTMASEWPANKSAMQGLISIMTNAESQTFPALTTQMQNALASVSPFFKAMANDAGTSLRQITGDATFNMTLIENVLGSKSAAAKQAIADNFDIAAQDIEVSMQRGVVSTQAGMKSINDMLNQGLKSLGEPSINFFHPANSPGAGGSSLGTLKHLGHAYGGFIGDPGTRGPDVVPAMLGMGEAVLNAPQQKIVNAALAAKYGTDLTGVFAATKNSRHYASGGYIDPIPGFTLGREDMGVDADARVGQPILAMGDSKLTGVIPNWYAGQPLLDFQLLNGIDKGRYWYVAEQITPVTEHIPSFFKEGQVVARFAPSGTGIEIGWAGNASGSTLAQTLGQQWAANPGAGQSTPTGSSFMNFLRGAPGGGLIPGGPGAGAMWSNIKAPYLNTTGSVASMVNDALTIMTAGANAYGSSLASTAAFPGTSAGSTAGLSGSLLAMVHQIAARKGWGGAQIQDWINVINRESGGSLTARNASSGAYGIAQFINGPSEYYKYGGNPNSVAGQLIAMANYISGRYGSPAGAWAHEQSAGWYSGGGPAKPKSVTTEKPSHHPSLGKPAHPKSKVSKDTLNAIFSILPNAQNTYNNLQNVYGPWETGLSSLYGIIGQIAQTPNADGSAHDLLDQSDVSLLMGLLPPGLLQIDGVAWPGFSVGENVYDAQTAVDLAEIGVYQQQQAAETFLLNEILGTTGKKWPGTQALSQFNGQPGGLYERYQRLASINAIIKADMKKALVIQKVRDSLQKQLQKLRTGDIKTALKNAGSSSAIQNQINNTQSAMTATSNTISSLQSALAAESALGPGADQKYMATLRQKIAQENQNLGQLQQAMNKQQKAMSMGTNTATQRSLKRQLLENTLTDEYTNLGTDFSQLGQTLGNLGGVQAGAPLSSYNEGAAGGVVGQINSQISTLNSAITSILGDLQTIPFTIGGFQLDIRNLAYQKTQSNLPTALQQEQIDLLQQLNQQLGEQNYTLGAQYGVLKGYSSAQSAFIGGFETGSAYIPRTGMALLHEGEAVLPASQNPFAGGSAMRPEVHIHGGLGALVDSVEHVVAGQRSEISDFVNHDLAQGARARRLLPGGASAGALRAIARKGS